MNIILFKISNFVYKIFNLEFSVCNSILEERNFILKNKNRISVPLKAFSSKNVPFMKMRFQNE